MKLLAAVATLLAALVVLPVAAFGAPSPKTVDNFHGSFTGNIIYFNPAGFEPDFDLLERVIIQTTVRSPHTPPMTLILDAYLENFQPDTTPILPDLIHPKVQVSTTLGGFFTGQAVIVGPSGKILYSGAMYAEAFLTPRGIQHMIVRLGGQGPAEGGYMNLDSVFHAYKSSKVAGSLYGNVKIPPKAMIALRAPGNRKLSLKQILKDFNVQKPAQKGTAGNGQPGSGTCVMGHCTNVGTPIPAHPTATAIPNNSPATKPSHPIWMTVLGGVFIGTAVILMVIFFFQRKTTESTSQAQTDATEIATKADSDAEDKPPDGL